MERCDALKAMDRKKGSPGRSLKESEPKIWGKHLLAGDLMKTRPYALLQYFWAICYSLLCRQKRTEEMERDMFCQGAVTIVAHRWRQRGFVRLIGRPHRRSLDILMIALTVMLVGAMLAACNLPWQQSSSPGNSGSAATSTAALSPAPTNTPIPPTPIPTPLPPTLQFNTSASVDMNGLHIQTDGLVCPGLLVLKQEQHTYDSAAIQQIDDYLSSLAHATDYTAPSIRDGSFHYTPEVASQLPPVPDTLRWVPGGPSCSGSLEITNTGAESIQITGIGLSLDALPSKNDLNYQLLDLCSVLGETFPNPCSPTIGSGPFCDYTATILLQSGTVGTKMNGAIDSSDHGLCPLPLTMAPTQLVSVVLHMNSALSAELYRVKLSVTITTASGTQQALTLPAAFTSTLAFTSLSQFSCYQLTGNTFTSEALPGDPTYLVFPCI